MVSETDPKATVEGVLSELLSLLDQDGVYTEQGGNDIEGDHVESADRIEGENTIGVAFVSGERFFITVEAV